jgi:hypothetical protein
MEHRGGLGLDGSTEVVAMAKCQHETCRCEVDAGVCGDVCRDAASHGGHEGACPCGHAACQQLGE